MRHFFAYLLLLLPFFSLHGDAVPSTSVDEGNPYASWGRPPGAPGRGYGLVVTFSDTQTQEAAELLREQLSRLAGASTRSHALSGEIDPSGASGSNPDPPFPRGIPENEEIVTSSPLPRGVSQLSRRTPWGERSIGRPAARFRPAKAGDSDDGGVRWLPRDRSTWILAVGIVLATLFLMLSFLCPLVWWLRHARQDKSNDPLVRQHPCRSPGKRMVCPPPLSPRFSCVDSAVQRPPPLRPSPVASPVPLPLPPPPPRQRSVTPQPSVTRGSSQSETDSEHAFSPTRSPLRSKTRGLLERRGSNASLTLDLNKSGDSAQSGKTVAANERSGEQYLLSAGKRMSREQLRKCLEDVRALHTEFWDIPMNHPERVQVPGCGTKNRYKTILPNEHSRVHLLRRDSSEDDYINANYVGGYGGEARAYIATQGPLVHTVADFWHMVWQERVPAIVMITNLTENSRVGRPQAKCEAYVPETCADFEGLRVEVAKVVPRDGYLLRELYLEKSGERRPVHHLWYTAWPDHQTPRSSHQLLSLALEVELLRHDVAGVKGPVVVHCSAGIGRTGCFIASSIGMRQLLEENSVDVLGIVCALRRDRGGMVQTAEQYEFVYRTLCLFEQSLPKETAGRPSAD